MPLKQIGVLEEVYEGLKEFRDTKGLTSFSNAIQSLLNFYQGKEEEVSAFIKVKLGQFDAQADKLVEKITNRTIVETEKKLEERFNKFVQDFLEKQGALSKQKVKA